MKSVLPWSWSSYESYKTCPRKYYEEKILQKYPFKDTVHTIWGKKVHKALENQCNLGERLPPEMAQFQPAADKIINAPADNYAELKMGIDKNMNAVGFFGRGVWSRGIADLVKVNSDKAIVVDYKTGKRKPSSLQLDLMAVMVFALFPEVHKITSLFMWFKEPSKPTSKQFTRDKAAITLQQFLQGVADMEYSEQHNIWPEQPSGLCKGWCPVTDCRYWQPPRDRR